MFFRLLMNARDMAVRQTQTVTFSERSSLLWMWIATNTQFTFFGVDVEINLHWINPPSEIICMFQEECQDHRFQSER